MNRHRSFDDTVSFAHQCRMMLCIGQGLKGPSRWLLSRAPLHKRRGRSLTSRIVGRSMKTYSPHLQNINFLIALVSMEFVSLLKQRLLSQQPTLYEKPSLEETWSWSQLVHDHGHEVFYCGVCVAQLQILLTRPWRVHQRKEYVTLRYCSLGLILSQ